MNIMDKVQYSLMFAKSGFPELKATQIDIVQTKDGQVILQTNPFIYEALCFNLVDLDGESDASYLPSINEWMRDLVFFIEESKNETIAV